MYIYVKGTKSDKEAFLSFELVLVSSEAPVDIEACCCDVFGPKKARFCFFVLHFRQIK